LQEFLRPVLEAIMEAFILVHGITGARMNLAADEIWPPTVMEFVFGYKRLTELQDPAAIATAIIDKVWIEQIYRPIMDDLDKVAASVQGIRINVHYDWRRDILSEGAPILARAIEKAVANGATSVTLVCHSMGGLLARLVLESGQYSSAAWFSKIRKLVTICTPHLGSAVPLGYALGLEGAYGITRRDLRILLGDSRYPAGYQCLPVQGHDALFDIQSGTAVAQDIYQAAVDTKYGLTRSNVLALVNARSQIDYTKRPRHVAYFLFGGIGHPTNDSYLFNNVRYLETYQVDGDGTVPLSSTVPGFGIAFTLPGDHVKIMMTRAFREKLYDVLGAPIMPSLRAADKPGVVLSVNQRVVRPGEVVNVLIIPDSQTAEISGHLRISAAVDEQGSALAPYGAGVRLAYSGPATTHIRAQITAPTSPGAYVIHFDGTHATTDAAAAVVYVSKDTQDLGIGPAPQSASEKKAGGRSKSKKRKAK
jgi:pimeloyl-ACP methyl ester carboxylesterase